MITVLVDHDIEGQAMMLWAALGADGWPEVFPIRFMLFSQVGLPEDSNDRTVWRFAQQNRMILLTGNRRMKEDDSLERTIREENTPASLPVITIGRIKRVIEKKYREQCQAQLLNILLDLDNYLGTARIFIP